MKEIPGVPESITREQYRSLIESLGFDASKLKELRFTTNGVYAVVIAYGPDGRQMLDPMANAVATHDVYIPVVDPS